MKRFNCMKKKKKNRYADVLRILDIVCEDIQSEIMTQEQKGNISTGKKGCLRRIIDAKTKISKQLGLIPNV